MLRELVGSVRALPPLTFVYAFFLCVAVAMSRRAMRDHVAAAKLAEQRLIAAMDELTERILQRVETPQLLTHHSIRSLAMAVERVHRSPVLTDRLIAESIRAAAFDLESVHRGPELLLRLEILNAPLEAFDSSGPPLASLANLDRLIGFAHAQPMALRAPAITLGIALLMSLIPITRSASAFVAVSAVTAALAGVAGAARSRKFWSGAGPRKLNAFLDTFLLATIRRSLAADIFWHVVWAPIWETDLITGLILRGRRLAFVRMHHYRAWKEEELLAAAAGVTAEAERRTLRRMLWSITGNPRYKDSKTELRHIDPNLVPAMRRQLDRELRDLELDSVRLTPMPRPERLRRIAEVCDRLFAATGDVSYRERASVARADVMR